MSTAELITSLKTKINALGELAKQGGGVGEKATLNTLIDRSITSIVIPAEVTEIGIYAFANCAALTDITIPNTVTLVRLFAFNNCLNLEFVTLESGFNADGLKLSASTKFSTETLVAMFNALSIRNGQTPYTLTLGATNLAKLTNDQIAVATNKNWTLA